MELFVKLYSQDWRAYLNMSLHYLKKEVAKYICSLLRIFKIARQTQQSRDLIKEYKLLCLSISSL